MGLLKKLTGKKSKEIETSKVEDNQSQPKVGQGKERAIDKLRRELHEKQERARKAEQPYG